MGIERVDNWELVLTQDDLDSNDRYKIEDSHIRCALIREIGTDSPDPVTFGVRDHPYIDIDTFIAPYYKSSNNLNLMRFSRKKGLKWNFTGFELPLPLDMELDIDGLDAGGEYRVYMKGSLYKSVLSNDDPINQYLMARMIEHSYKQLRPIYFKDITIPSLNFTDADDELVLDADTNTLVQWKPQDPKYTIAPSQNTTYVINNTIQVMWGDEGLLPKEVAFRLKHDRIDVGVTPRLDHMFMPPGDGITRYVEETLDIGGIDDCDDASNWAATTGSVVAATAQANIMKEGDAAIELDCSADTFFAPDGTIYNDLAAAVDLSDWTMIGFWIGSIVALNAGDLTLVCGDVDGTAGDGIALPFVNAALPTIPLAAIPDTLTYMRVLLPAMPGTILKSIGLKNTSGADIKTKIYIDDIRALPLKVRGNPMESYVKSTFDPTTVGAAIASINYANGEIQLTYDTIPDELLIGYYALRSGGGRDVFSLREINQVYHRIEYPHKQSYVFSNKTGNDPTGAATMDLYTLAEYYQVMPAELMVPPAVQIAANRYLV